MSKTPITPGQCRAARALIGWNQGELAKRAGVSRETVIGFESGKRVPIFNNLAAIMMAFMSAGLRLIGDGERGANADPEGRGVRFARPEGEAADPQTAAVIDMFREIVLKMGERP
jgi:DNA-binding XRE family transcriptional regulator